MAFKVRIHGYRGIVQIPAVLPRQFSGDSVQVLYEPYEWRQVLTTNLLVPQTTVAQAGDLATIIRVEVPDGQAIRYEVCPPSRVQAPDVDSPILTGRDQFFWGAGWTFKLIDAEGT